ncbi:MAG: tRNA threonylcarbamoyladenosine dehydratase [Bacteroidales bacterium]
MNTDWQSRTRMLLGNRQLQKLQNIHVLVIGLGGVGSWAAEHLVRSGTGTISLADNDAIAHSNINRQVMAMHSTVGKSKTEVMAKRLLDINPALKINTHQAFISDENINTLPSFNTCDYVLDCIDTLSPKIEVVKKCLDTQTVLISSLGSAGKTDPAAVKTADISNSYNCTLGRMLRKRLHKEGIYKGFTVVFSTEKTDRSKVVNEESRNKRSNSGTISVIPAIFGAVMAGEVIKRCLNNHE